jgi:streptomycin 6-kinase
MPPPGPQVVDGWIISLSAYFGVFDELQQLLVHIPKQDRLMIESQALDCRSAHPLHGDAHRKNVLHTPQRPL